MTSSVPSSPSQPLIEALVQFHKTVPAISKTANAQYGKFADLETVLSTVTPHLIKNGLVISQTFEPSEGLEPILVTRLLHVSGAEIVSRLPMILGKSSNPLHSFGASCTYLKRYSLLALIGLTADMDGDGDFADTKPAAKLQTQQTPKKGPAVEGVAEDDQPLTTEERKMLVGLISEMKPGKREDFCKSFRFAFKLGDNAKVAPAITSRKHQVWIQENA
jgi:hypothetical protein